MATDVSAPRISVTLAYGKVNFSDAAMSIGSFKVTSPFVRASAMNSGIPTNSSRPIFNQAIAGFQQGGGFTKKDVSFEVGTILMFQYKRTRRGLRANDSAIILRLRPDAAMLAINVSLPTGDGGLLGDTYNVFIGNADRLTADEARAYGIAVPPGYDKTFMDEDFVDDAYKIVEVAPARTPKPTFEKVDVGGVEVVREVRKAPVRRIRRTKFIA